MNAMEEWRPVVGYAGFYEVSDQGTIRSLDRIVKRLRGSHGFHRGKVLQPFMVWTSASSDYQNQVVALCRDGKPRRHKVSKLVLEAFIGPRPTGLECCHYDGDTSNNKLLNIRWDTKRSNQADHLRHGRNVNATKRVCPRSHDLFPPNLVNRTRRACLACKRTHGWASKRGIEMTDPRWKEEADRRYGEIMTT